MQRSSRDGVQDIQDLAEFNNTGNTTVRDRIIERNQDLVKSIAIKRMNAETPLDDLVQTGNLGLIMAVDNYDASRDTKFSTYAHPLINGAISRFYRDEVPPVYVDRQMQELLRRIMSVEECLEVEGIRLSDTQLAILNGTDEETIREARRANVALDTKHLTYDYHDQDPSAVIEELIPYGGSEQKSPAELLEDNIQRILVRSRIEQMDETMRTVMQLKIYEGMSNDKIGHAIGRSDVTVARILHDGIALLMEEIGGIATLEPEQLRAVVKFVTRGKEAPAEKTRRETPVSNPLNQIRYWPFDSMASFIRAIRASVKKSERMNITIPQVEAVLGLALFHRKIAALDRSRIHMAVRETMETRPDHETVHVLCEFDRICGVNPDTLVQPGKPPLRLKNRHTKQAA